MRDPQQLQKQMLAEMVESVAANLPLGLGAGLFNALLLAFILRHDAPRPVLAAWVGAISLISVLRFLFCSPRFLTKINRNSTAFKEKVITLGALVSGLVWGMAPIFLFSDNPLNQAFMTFVFGGMIAGAAGSYAFLTWAFYAYSLPMLLPLLIRFFMIGGEVYNAMGVMASLLVVMIVLAARSIYRITTHNTILAADNQGMVASLRAGKECAERLNLELQQEIGERERMELELVWHKENLESQVAERTAELTAANAQLKKSQAQILQQEKMASIGQLAAGVAHEINNPIGFIKSNLSSLSKYGDRLREYAESVAALLAASNGGAGLMAAHDQLRKRLKVDYIIEDLAGLVNECIEGTDRIKEIVVNLKNFSRVDARKIQQADINDCLKSTLKIIWNELKYKAHVTEEYGDLPLTRCLPMELNQVFMNILLNAVQAIEKQGEISIRTYRQDNSILVEVADSGCGIPAEELPRIFEPFFTTKPVGKGTGLGMSIAYDIVSKHHGTIQVASEVGKGTTFTIAIPVVTDEDPMPIGD